MHGYPTKNREQIYNNWLFDRHKKPEQCLRLQMLLSLNRKLACLYCLIKKVSLVGSK